MTAYSVALSLAMKNKGLNRKALRTTLGLHEDTVDGWCQGKMMPSLVNSLAVSELLDRADLHNRVLYAYTKTCGLGECSKRFVDPSYNRASLFCSQSCKRTHRSRIRRGGSLASAATALHRWELARDAINAFCWGCEPTGLCVTSDCALREQSPLPLMRSRDELAMTVFAPMVQRPLR